MSYAYQKPPQPAPASIQSAGFKRTPSDFCVTENLGFTLTGEGEHLCVYVEKCGLNTGFVAQALAAWASIPQRDVGYCGLKDKHAITRQWFSLRLPKKCAPDTDFALEGARILERNWHTKKLPKGAHRSNTFSITLTEVNGNFAELEQSKQAIITQLEHIKTQGVPNYFGAQRFGKFGDNCEAALAMFAGKRVKRALRSILLSAARSHLFNAILAERVQNGTWQSPILGDVFNLDGTGSVFTPDELDDKIIKRHAVFDIHATGALWGRGAPPSFAGVAALETQVASKHSELCAGLEQAGLKQERRALRLVPRDLEWAFTTDDALKLTFALPKGAYATSVVDALVHTLKA